MAKHYKLECTGLRAQIIECTTDQVIAKGSLVQMQKLEASLNKGSGFKGNTPAFFIK